MFTRGGVISTDGAEFAVRVHGDTTIVWAGPEGANGTERMAVYFASAAASAVRAPRPVTTPRVTPKVVLEPG